MNLKIGVNNFNKATLKELNKLVTPQFKIDFKEKKDNFLSEPEIFEAFIMGLSANVAWDMIKALFNISCIWYFKYSINRLQEIFHFLTI